MKKTIAFILGMAFLLPLGSCFKTEEDIFPESPAQRLNKLSKDYMDVLCGAEDGWVMQYFANESEQGYPILMKFESNGSVTMASKNAVTTSNAYKEESSTFSMLQDLSVVVSFDTYNALLHTFSDPMKDGVGHGGDYEFSVVRTSAARDTVYMKGKKAGLPIRLVKFPKGASYTDEAGNPQTVDSWQSYFTALEALQNRYFHPSMPPYKITLGDETFDVDGLAYGLMQFVPSGLSEEEAFMRTYLCSFILNVDGSFRLCTPFKGEKDAFSIECFRPSDEGDSFVELGNGSRLLPPNLPGLMLDKDVAWKIDDTKDDSGNLVNMSGSFKALYEAAVAGAAEKSRDIAYALTYDPLAESYCIRVTLTKKGTGDTGIALFYTDLTVGGDGASVSLAATGEGDRNAEAYGKTVAGLKDMVFGFSGDYAVTVENTLRPSRLKFVSKADAGIWFFADLQ